MSLRQVPAAVAFYRGLMRARRWCDAHRTTAGSEERQIAGGPVDPLSSGAGAAAPGAAGAAALGAGAAVPGAAGAAVVVARGAVVLVGGLGIRRLRGQLGRG